MTVPLFPLPYVTDDQVDNACVTQRTKNENYAVNTAVPYLLSIYEPHFQAGVCVFSALSCVDNVVFHRKIWNAVS